MPAFMLMHPLTWKGTEGLPSATPALPGKSHRYAHPGPYIGKLRAACVRLGLQNGKGGTLVISECSGKESGVL